jgi:serine/threonine-protein kinase
VIHRDLKPANVMIEDTTRLKVLDFGLAKIAQRAGCSADTATERNTEPGAVLGTVPYMSPEQIQGRKTDFRSDIFALGIILYEMATGRRPFAGGAPAETAASILRDEPTPLGEQRPDLPGAFARIVSRCLAESPEDRYAGAKALHRELELLR